MPVLLGMSYYERNLPHWHPDRTAIFLTWRLYGSLPTAVVRSIQSENVEPGRQFTRFDRYLDHAQSGPFWLRNSVIAGLIIETLRRGHEELHQYALQSYVVMPNHVHLLIVPHTMLSRITHGIKGVTSRDANRMLRRTGKPFWQDESFDHWIRDAGEEQRIQSYIEQNPVAAGFVRRPEDWLWSSAHK
ncbi:MAG TPA: transposase [Candidatus Methylomirabilis sp.]|nr:transposase [Candidatus Methylomirabilis sp.]